ncbi:MAG: site-specific DNA-methyltransferase [Bryobacteraceae bacterium]
MIEMPRVSSGLPVNQVICGDCLEVMRDWPDGCVDLVLTDPPYGIGENNKKNLSRSVLARNTDYGEYNWDRTKVSDETIREMIRVSRNQIVFGGNYYASVLGNTSCYIVWDKDNGANDFADCELAWASFKKAVRKVKWRWHGMLQEPGHPKEKRVHPTQKPLGVALWIVERYSQPGQTVLDPCCGSGTFCLAAKQLGRNYIGIDISEDYCHIARARLAVVEMGASAEAAERYLKR